MIDESDNGKFELVKSSESLLSGFDGIEVSKDFVEVVEREESFADASGTMSLMVGAGRGWTARLLVEYSWNSSGTLFTCHAKRYIVSNNGRRSGNVILSFTSATKWGEAELTGSAIQDGEWHDISGGGSVNSNGTHAWVNFKYIFDRPFESDPTDAIGYRVVPPPKISNPKVVWNAKPVISGTGIAGAVVKLYKAYNDSVVLATTPVRGDNTWNVQLERDLPMADPFQITAKHVSSGNTSTYAYVVRFAVLFKPIIGEITLQEGNKPSISGGGGLKDAMIEIWPEGGIGAPLLKTVVRADGYWSVSAVTAWNPGKHFITARQVGQNTGEHSDWTGIRSIEVKPPKSLITPPPVPAAAYQPITVTGVTTGVGAGAVRLTMFNDADQEVAGIFTGSGATRNFIPIANWPAGISGIYVVQAVGGVASDPSALVSVALKPPSPIITPPPIPTTVNQTLTVKYVMTESVDLQMSTEAGMPVAGNFTGSNATRTFIPTESWAVGTTRVKVVHTVRGVASDPSALVSVAVKPPIPVITPPPIPSTVYQALTINNVMTESVDLQMSTEAGMPVAGNFTGSNATRTFIPTESWAVGTTRVKVVHTVRGVVSDPSELVTIRILAKPPKPHLTQPLPASSHLASLAVEGTCEAGATVEVQYASGIALEGEMSYVQTQWSFKHPWEPGQQQIKAVQTSGGLTSDPTDMLDFYIRPPQAVIEQPDTPVAVRGELKISDVWSGVVALRLLTQRDVRVDGKFAGDGATRTFIPDADWTPGENIVYVIQTVNDVDSDPSDPCTFTVAAEDRPEAPRFQQPQLGGRTSRFPTIEVVGLPGALHTVRLEGGATLHEGAAEADGSLVFTVVEPLVPGAIALEVKQMSNGSESDWSAPHRFTIKAPPQTPAIEAPQANSETSRYPSFRGTGETGGAIVLHYANDPQELIASVDGSTRWRWTAGQAWSLGEHNEQARQTVDGDCSDWSEVRSFKVRESRYAIGDANPAMGTPVVGTEQSVLLRVQVISGVTGEVAEGVEVEWRFNGEQELLATTQTDFTGWTWYRYTPETAGKHEILADITQENAGVVMTELYEVNAVLHDDWAQTAELYLDGQRVDQVVSDLMLLRKSQPYKLELKVNDGSVLIGSTVTLQNLWGAKERGLTFIPDLGTPQVIKEGVSVHWSIFAEEGTSGIFGLSLSSPVMSDWQLPAYVEAGDLAEAVKVDLDTFPQLFGGGPAFPCLGATHTVTVRPQDHSFLLGHDVVLELSAQAAELGVTVSPTTPQTLGDEGVSWTLNCVDSTQNGDFAVWLKVPARDFNSLELPMSLGHNKVNISERFGPQEMGGSAPYWKYGIRATSTFTGQPAGRVPVTVAVTGKPTVESLTAFNGWIFINYHDGESAILTIHNRYDGSLG